MRINVDNMKSCIKYCFVVLSLLAVSTSNAEDMRPAKNGFYMSVSTVSNSIGEEFDDTKVLTSSTMIVGVPKINNGTGLSLSWGSRTGPSAFEVDYIRTTHNTTSTLWGNSTATFTSLDFNGKIYFNETSKVQPFFLFGVGLQWLTIENNTFTAAGFESTEFTGGRSLNIGGGLSYYLTPQWFLNGSALYRYGSFGKAEGLTIQDRLGHSGLTYSFGIAYVF